MKQAVRGAYANYKSRLDEAKAAEEERKKQREQERQIEKERGERREKLIKDRESLEHRAKTLEDDERKLLPEINA